MKLLAHLLYFVALIAAYGILQPIGDRFGGVLILYPIVAALGFVTIFVHELGHAAAAHFYRARITRFVVWPIAFTPASRRLSFARRVAGSEVGGYVAYRLDRIEARRKHVVIALAGPGANLLLVLALWLGFQAALVTGSLFGALAMLSLGAGISNLIPFSGSDGGQILANLRRAQPQKR